MAKKTEDDELNELQELMDKESAKTDPTDLFVTLLTDQAADSFEMARGKYPQSMPAKGRTPAHAWGKQQPEGSVHLPAGFEGVTTLGPVVMVCAPKSSPKLHLGTSHVTVLVVYQDGFAYQAGGKEVKLWRFEDVAAIQTKVEDHSPTMVHEFTLFRTNGEAVILDDEVQAVQAAADQIKLAVFKDLVTRFVQQYEAGVTQTFGPVTVQKQNGLQLWNHRYAWEDIQNAQVQFGEFKVMLNDNKKATVRTSEIPNIELLGRVIGLDQAEVGNGHFLAGSPYDIKTNNKWGAIDSLVDTSCNRFVDRMHPTR